MDNFREAMHGDAARTAALLLMIACSTDARRRDAPRATRRRPNGYPLSRLAAYTSVPCDSGAEILVLPACTKHTTDVHNAAAPWAPSRLR